ncbi:flagellar hook-length control protein FliK [Alkalimonas delamerensis]|uniref:Flagellar hook-length control protein FliK n=1 Tax=Alkalimonas delamerensis TaxID=265981 RepID=A0ABT9GMM8_9GAMM|nr:flagellar hook-length control protein FliK [Alkalimonas delamerensis]MDP4528231.1 flagellar hook-length control protein FliK [Alkalimonas delamerensis]
MADALQMFLLSGAGPVLSMGETATEARHGMDDETAELLPFAKSLASASNSSTQDTDTTERQKAAVAAPQDDDADLLNSENLQAIIADENSSDDDKDAARAWLAIIRNGQRQSAGLTAGQSNQAQLNAAKEGFIGVGINNRSDKATAVAFDATALPGLNDVDHLGDDAAEDAELSEASPKAKAASISLAARWLNSGQASEKSASKEALPMSEKAQRIEKESVTLKGQLTQQGQQTTSGLQQQAVKGNEAAEATAGTDKVISQASSWSQSLAASSEQSADKESDEEGTVDLVSEMPAKNKSSTTSDKSVLSSVQGSHQTSKVSDETGKMTTESQQVKAQPLSEVQLAQAEAEMVGVEPVPAAVVLPAGSKADVSAGTLASAAQERAELQSKAAETVLSSGNRGTGEQSGAQKDQLGSAGVQAAWQQAKADAPSEPGGRFDLLSEQAADKDSAMARTAASSQLQASVSTTMTTPVMQASGTSVSQLMQAQGSTAPVITSTPTVSELLRQPVNLLAADASGQLRERLVLMVRNSVHSADIKLEPAELGSMHIRVSMQQEQASVQFLVQQAHAKEVLEQQLPRLRDMLSEQGIELADGQVAQQQSGQQGQQQGSSAGSSAAEEEGVPAEQRQVVAAASERLVDYYA